MKLHSGCIGQRHGIKEYNANSVCNILKHIFLQSCNRLQSTVVYSLRQHSSVCDVDVELNVEGSLWVHWCPRQKKPSLLFSVKDEIR